LRDEVGAIVERYAGLVVTDFDAASISITEDGRLAYAGVELDFERDPAEPKTLVRRVQEWAIENLAFLPGGRWRLRRVP
jgi:hypothetical protein